MLPATCVKYRRVPVASVPMPGAEKVGEVAAAKVNWLRETLNELVATGVTVTLVLV